MATPRYAWGIDIGNRALKAVRLSPGAEGFQIDDYDVVEHEQVLSNAGDNKESLIQAALANFVQRHELKGAPVAIGVSGQNSFARFIKLPPVEPRKIPEIVRFEAIQQIPFPLDEVEWSYQLFQDEKSPDVEVGIFAMRKELVNQHINYFTEAGLNVQAVQMNPLAVYNAMYYDQRIKGTTMIVDLGSENTDLIIAEGETIWLRSIPIGGNKFTEALVNAFKLKFPKAEDLKRNAATSKYGRQILQAMKPVFNELVSEIQRSIGFYASVHRDSRISRVLALGGTFRLPGLQKYVQQNLQIDVQRIDRLGTSAPPDAKTATMFNENILSSVSAYGLAIQALGQAKINSSLLPLKIRREKMWREKTPWFATAAAVFIAAPLLAYGSIMLAQRSLDGTSAVETANLAALKSANDLNSDWDTNVENAGAPDRTRAINFQSLQQGRDIQNTLLTDIGAALPAPPAALLSNQKGKMPDRGSREIIRIDRIAMDYHEDVTPLLALPDQEYKMLPVQGIAEASQPEGAATTSGRGAAGNMGNYRGGRGGRFSRQMPQAAPAEGAAAPTTPKQRGFFVEIVCTTPNANGASYVLGSFVSKLGAMTSSSPEANYAIKRVIEPVFSKLGDDPNLQKSAQPGGFGRQGLIGRRGQRDFGRFAQPGFNPRGQPGAINPVPTTNPAEPEQFDPLKDPATGEDMSKDTRVTIRMLVLLDPPKPAPANGQVAQSTP
jgi:type IV pilus assembly protein PilM